MRSLRLGNVKLVEIRPGEWYSLGEGISAKGFAVPRRDEYSDTVAFLIRGPKRTLLYVPDTDTWKTWTRPLPQVIEEEKVDYALLDATFYSPEELPDRDTPSSPLDHGTSASCSAGGGLPASSLAIPRSTASIR